MKLELNGGIYYHLSMKAKLTQIPKTMDNGLLGFPFCANLDELDAHVAIMGIPYGLPYYPNELANDQSLTPDLLRQNAQDGAWHEPRTIKHFDWDLGGDLLHNQNIQVFDCGNVTSDLKDPREHYRRAEKAVKKIFNADATLISIGGDHGIPIPIFRGLPKNQKITLVQVDAHLDWRDEINGEKEGYSSGIRRASEMDHISEIFQIGLRGVGSGRHEEFESAKNYGAHLISAYEVHELGIKNILERIPEGSIYLTIDADGLDPTIMPAVNAPTPGGLNWIQIRELIHGLVSKGRVLGMDLVEISPSFEGRRMTFIHAERIICNFIGAIVRAGYFN